MNRKRLLLIILMVFISLSFSVCAEEVEISECFEERVTVTYQGDNKLAEGYIHKMMYPKPGKTSYFRGAVLIGERLEGINRELYIRLKSEISKIAGGKRASTMISVPVDELYEKLIYTKADLGVDVIVENGSVTEAAMDAIKRATAFDSSAILQALMADCPYEMYWYDKTEGCVIGGPAFGFTSSRVTVKGEVCFKFTVSGEYQGNDLYQIDTSYGTAVTKAVANARSIVEKYEGWADYPRLLAYKNAICNMVSYNHTAAGSSTAYGNPWQLVWVFDGDPETNVVCEGYAKAFQYLNDLSSSSVTVVWVSRTIYGEDHMWNVVRMKDGFNYLADVTNCDTDSVGYPEELFLVGYSGSDSANEYTYTVKSRDIVYIYDSVTAGLFAADELAMKDTGYQSAEVPVPVFSAEKTEILINESVDFIQTNTDEYDLVFIRAAYIPDEGEPMINVYSSSSETWTFGEDRYHQGTVEIQFAGQIGDMTSFWSEPIVLTATILSDLGNIGLTNDFSAVYAGNEDELSWSTSENGVNGFSLSLSEAEEGLLIKEDFDGGTTSYPIQWAYCPGSYTLHFTADVEPGYEYTIQEELPVTILESGKEWLIRPSGILYKYFGSSGEVTIPQKVDNTPVNGMAGYTFRQSKANEVTIAHGEIQANAFSESRVHILHVTDDVEQINSGVLADCDNLEEVYISSVTKVQPGAFAGSGNLTVYGYTNSEAETVAETDNVPFVSLGIKPNTPVCVASADKGYVGYTLVIRMNEAADSVLVRETGETINCNETDVLILLSETGDNEYTLAAIKDGVRGDYGETICCSVTQAGNSTIHIPAQTRIIRQEALAGIDASIVILPQMVETVQSRAFADNSCLQIVEIEGDEDISADVFDNSENAVLYIQNYDGWFGKGYDFLTKETN